MAWRILYPAGFPIGNAVPLNYGKPESGPYTGAGKRETFGINYGNKPNRWKKEARKAQGAKNRRIRAELYAEAVRRGSSMSPQEWHERLRALSVGAA